MVAGLDQILTKWVWGARILWLLIYAGISSLCKNEEHDAKRPLRHSYSDFSLDIFEQLRKNSIVGFYVDFLAL